MPNLRETTSIALIAGGAFLILSILSLACPSVPRAEAQDSLYIYPKNGQSDEQQKKDRYECHMWAVKQTGYDPTMPQQSSAPAGGPSGGGEMVRGAGRGAALGAIGGAIGGDAGEGAAIGAGVGGLLGHMRARRSMQEQQQAAMQKHNAIDQQLGQYDQAYATCLRGRGYTVSE